MVQTVYQRRRIREHRKMSVKNITDSTLVETCERMMRMQHSKNPDNRWEPCGNCTIKDINNECGVKWLFAEYKGKEKK